MRSRPNWNVDSWVSCGLAIVAVPLGAAYLYGQWRGARAPLAIASPIFFLAPLLLAGVVAAFIYGLVRSRASLARSRLGAGVVWLIGFFLLVLVPLLPICLERIGMELALRAIPIPPSATTVARQRQFLDRERCSASVTFQANRSVPEVRDFYLKHLGAEGWTHEPLPNADPGLTGGRASVFCQFFRGTDWISVQLDESPTGTSATIGRTFKSHFY